MKLLLFFMNCPTQNVQKVYVLRLSDLLTLTDVLIDNFCSCFLERQLIDKLNIQLQAMDNSHVSLVSVNLRADGFDKFRLVR